VTSGMSVNETSASLREEAHTFSKVLSIVNLCGKHTWAPTFENLFRVMSCHYRLRGADRSWSPRTLISLSLSFRVLSLQTPWCF